jgi:hypothetical protein
VGLWCDGSVHAPGLRGRKKVGGKFHEGLTEAGTTRQAGVGRVMVVVGHVVTMDPERVHRP